MRVLVIQNFEDTGLGQVGRALDEAGAEIDLVMAHEGEPLPASAEGHDALVVLGGAQSALDDADYPYLPALARLTRTFGEAGKAVLGICLGAQLVARGHGGGNILARPPEFGWHEVTLRSEAADDPVLSAAPGTFPIFHWHNDTFTLPEGATHLASSAMTPNQAFRIGRAVYAIQFHFEADTVLVEDWTATFADYLAERHPDWSARHAAEAARHGAAADVAGLAIARAWVRCI